MALERPIEHISEQHDLRTLIVGDLPRWEAEGRDVSSFGAFHFVALGELTAELLRECDPAIILSPLVADEFDALDVAKTLADLEFKGRYRALSPTSADGEVIRSEVAAIAPTLDFDVLDLKAA